MILDQIMETGKMSDQLFRSSIYIGIFCLPSKNKL
jgi:hypothetical protein